MGLNGRIMVRALAVASEPNIFWSGADAISLIPVIDPQMGHLEPAEQAHNGPSGRALDDQYLGPLGLDRGQVWLSDMVPHSLSNSGQQAAILKHYEPLRQQMGLPESTMPLVPKTRLGWDALINTKRIVDELEQSGADTIITLGNPVIKHFLNRVAAIRVPVLTVADYGKTRELTIRSRSYRALCLAHMRVTAIHPIPKWHDAHKAWAAIGPTF
jgi:hypothetical protein